MIDLHDSHGRHIANFVSGQLHDVQGRNIGHYLENEGIFINMQGYYLGEIVDKRSYFIIIIQLINRYVMVYMETMGTLVIMEIMGI